jgi:hypothetical protein
MTRARDNAMGMMPGNVIQIARHEWRNETQSSSGYITLNGSSFTFTPKIATSKILIKININVKINPIVLQSPQIGFIDFKKSFKKLMLSAINHL